MNAFAGFCSQFPPLPHKCGSCRTLPKTVVFQEGQKILEVWTAVNCDPGGFCLPVTEPALSPLQWVLLHTDPPSCPQDPLIQLGRCKGRQMTQLKNNCLLNCVVLT